MNVIGEIESVILDLDVESPELVEEYRIALAILKGEVKSTSNSLENIIEDLKCSAEFAPEKAAGYIEAISILQIACK